MPSDIEVRVEARHLYSNIYYLTLILGALTAFAPLATDMYLASFPLLAESFQAEPGSVQLGLSVFFLGLALGQLIYGPLIDRFGRKQPLLIGISLFVAASFLIVVAPTIESFVFLRFLQAMGGCTGMIVGRAIIADLFREREAARVLSMMTLVQGLAPLLAPVLGGYIIVFAGWKAVFLFLGFFGIVCLAAVKWKLAETLPVDQRRRESFICVLNTWRQLVVTRDFIVPTLAGAFAFAGILAFISESPFVYMKLHGVSEQHYGWLFGLNAVGLILASQLNRFLLTCTTSQVVIGVSLAIMVTAAFGLVLFSQTASLTLLIALLFVCLANVPLVAANAVAVAMEASGMHRGSGSAIIGVLQFGIAALASVAVGFLHDGSARPMAGVILLCSGVACLVWFLGTKRSP